MSERIFRFAPSPNGRLHLGHARSAFLCHDMARAAGGHFLIRIEDIDGARCRPEFEASILDDLARLGLTSDGPVRRQSEHLDDYASALRTLIDRGLAYPAFLSRAEVQRRVAAAGGGWPRDPDGAPLHPADDRMVGRLQAAERIARGDLHAWRLDMGAAIAAERGMAGGNPLGWWETGSLEQTAAADRQAIADLAHGRPVPRRIAAAPERWGDVVLSRKDAPASYHLAVVVDDAAQGVTDIVRGADLYHATSVHRLLQRLLGLPEARYHHHALLTDAEGRKLAKSAGDAGLGALLDAGAGPDEVRRLAGM